MTNILFLVYTVLFGVSFFAGSDDLYTVLAIMTGAAFFYGFFRCFYLTVRRGYFRRKYFGALLSLGVLFFYRLLPSPAAATVAYAFIAGWHYVIPFLRLTVLRLLYASRIKKACRARNYDCIRVKGGFMIRTPAGARDIRLIGSHRRMGLVRLHSDTCYTLRWVPTYVTARADFGQFILDGEAGAGLLPRLLMGQERVRALTWSEEPAAERVILFIPGLCEWRFSGTEQHAANGSVIHSVTLYDADAFIEQKLR